MTTATKTETKTGRTQATGSTTLTDDTKRAFEIHTLVCMLYGKIMPPLPWASAWWTSQPPPMGTPWNANQQPNSWDNGWPVASNPSGVWGW